MKFITLYYWLYSILPLSAVVIWYGALHLFDSHFLATFTFGFFLNFGIWILAKKLKFNNSKKSRLSFMPIGIFDVTMILGVACVFPLWTMAHGLITLLITIGFLYFYHPRVGIKMNQTSNQMNPRANQ